MFLVCGEAVIDLFQDKASGEMAFQGQAAGSPFNVTVGLARLDQKAALITGLSRDVFGARLIAAMEKEGVEWRLAPRTDRPTILSFVLVKPDGGPEYAFYGERGADTDVTVAGLPTPLPAEIKAVHVGGFPMAVEPAKTAYATLVRREANARFVSLDPNIRVSLMGDVAVFREHFEGLCASTALIKASSEDLHHLYPGADLKTVALRWKDRGASTVVITDGPNGASSWNAAGQAFVPTTPVKVVDTVGAGDSFMSALLAALAERDLLHREKLAQTSGETMQAILAFANRAAGITCTRRGSNPPTQSDLGAA
jgi:fructokinase